MFKVPSAAADSPAPQPHAAADAAPQPHAAAASSHAQHDRPEWTASKQACWVAGNVERVFGAEKRSAVARLLAGVCTVEAASGRERHALSLDSFCALADLGRSRFAGKFTLSVGTGMHRLPSGVRTEIVAYRMQIEGTVLAARTFVSEARETMLRFVRDVDRLGMNLPKDVEFSYCFNDAQLVNRLIDALPEEAGLHIPDALNLLAMGVDEINTFPEYVGKPHIAIAAKAMLFADYFPNHRFDIHFQREIGLNNSGYFLCVRPKIDQADRMAIAAPAVELHSAIIAPDQSAQMVPLLILAIQLRANNDVQEHHAIIDSDADLIARHRDAMTQDPVTLGYLVDLGDDPRFNCDNYRFLGCNAQQKTFHAGFGEKVLVFSNAPSTMGELRGERLQAMLEHGRYRNLNELMAMGHRTAADPILRAAMSPLKNDVQPLMLALDPDPLRILTKEIDLMRIADTTLGALWDPVRLQNIGDMRVERVRRDVDAAGYGSEVGFSPSVGLASSASVSPAVGRGRSNVGSPAAGPGWSAGASPVAGPGVAASVSHGMSAAAAMSFALAPPSGAAAAAAPNVSALQARRGKLRHDLRVDIFSAPMYGANFVPAVEENPAPEGVAPPMWNRLNG